MEKPTSFYDWEKNFKKSSEKKKKKPKTINSLGVSEESFVSYLKSWKSKNLDK